ncbi:MAG: PilN domain-containing protein [Oligoflexia bacterium]|nr:PilN domain-containing protein [Oligoflexia bacterium]
MIEVNLLGDKKSYKLPTLLGIDLSLLPIKGILIVYGFSFLLPVLVDYYANKNKILRNNVMALNEEIAKANEEGKKLDFLKEEVEKIETQEQRLNEKLNVVKKILKIKKNPLNIMLFIARKVNEDLWITSFAIENDILSISGESLSYKSVGDFINDLKNSIFFENGVVKLDESNTKVDELSSRRVESFKISAKIVRYE